ncbi:MAG: hypothetical protein RLN72_07260 [Henriciella sp.]
MKRLILALAAIALPFTASASQQLASDWGIKASGLYEDTVTLIEAIDTAGETPIPHDYEVEIERFALAAGKLGSWIDGNDGPSDLGCIFRGMAEEGVVQLDALYEAGSPADTRASLVRLATMFSDAEVIAVAAIHSSGHEAPAVSNIAAASCPVSAAAAKAALH